jgi:hypothetical protein
VLVGYSLDDPDFRQVWRVVAERLDRLRRIAYVILVGAGATDISRYERRGIKAINLAGTKARYAKVLAEAFTELRDYWRNAVIPASQVKEEQPVRELSLPTGSPTRLCFFAVPLSLLSFYKERVQRMTEIFARYHYDTREALCRVAQRLTCDPQTHR